MQGKKHYAEQLFTTFRLSEHVPEDNFYRRLSQATDLHWLYGATKGYYGTEGQQSIDPVVFFKLILIGYLENLASDRRIIATASLRLDLLLYLGYGLEEPLPWHSTLSRTRQLYGEELFKELFRRVLTQCVERGMVSGRRQAIDSAPVKANASMDSLQLKAIIADADAYAGELAENEEDKPGVSAAREKRVAQHHSYKAKAYKGMPAANRARAKFVSNHTHYSPTDPDARISVKPGKPRQLNYHAQVAVDTAHHVITHIGSSPADKKDSQSLPAVLAQALENLKANGLEAEAILADGGYSSGEALQALEDRGLSGYIPNFGQYKSERQGFSYDKAHDRYTCSRGMHLPYKKTLTSSLGYTRKVYRSSAKDCKDCPLRATCIGKSDFKKIEDTIDKPLYDRMEARKRAHPKCWNQMKRLRSATVEPVLGTLVNFLGLRRLNTRGAASANKCMLMAGAAYNLKKLLKWHGAKAWSIATALQKPALKWKKGPEGLCFSEIRAWDAVQRPRLSKVIFPVPPHQIAPSLD